MDHEGAPQIELSTALPIAAADLLRLDAEGVQVLEHHLARALGAAIPGSVVERQLKIPGWDPQPGHVDLFGRNEVDEVTWAAEIKLKATNDLYECLWDMAKMLWLAECQSITEVFIVAGTTERNWNKPIDCADLFEGGRHELVAEIERLRGWWIKYILGDSAGRPTSVPKVLDVDLQCRATFAMGGEPWEVRAIQISAPDEPSKWVPFVDGLPATGA